MKLLVKFMMTFLSIWIIVWPAYAQMEQLKRLEQPMKDRMPSSFREQIESQTFFNKAQTRELLDKGVLLTEPQLGSVAYQVHVLGEVNKPGTYRVMASDRLSEILERAGGVAEQGSKRRIEIRRGGKIEKRVDLLKFQLYGQLEHNPYLLDNDVVFVPLKNQTIQVVGAVKRPDVYELNNENTLSHAIQLAGGASGGVAVNEPIRVIRFVDGKKEVIEVSQSGTKLSDFEVKNGDVIYVPNVVTAGHQFDYDVVKLPGDNVFYPSYEDRVFVLGGVNIPGAYPFSPYYNIHQYISLAGGFTKLATGKIRILTADGKKYMVKQNKEVKVNPGDTILVGYRRIAPEQWVTLGMSLASFGLSTTSTVLFLLDKY